MPFDFGPRDDARYDALGEEEREYLLFLVDFATRVLEHRPRQHEALHNAANALTALGYYQSGLRCDAALVLLCPEDSLAQYNLACSQALNHQISEALETLALSIRLGYRDAGHMCKDPDLVALHALPQFRKLVEIANR